MITNIYVNGFRSLNDFSLNLLPGLNILVGPNGSGKTNIIAFFEFLSNLVEFGSSDSINKLGGAGSVFSKCTGKIDDFQKTINATVVGSTKFMNRYLNYKYSFVIEASSDFNRICFSQQEINICYTTKFQNDFPNNKKPFCLKRHYIDNQINHTVINYNNIFINSPFFSMITKENKIKKNEDTINSFLNGFIEPEFSIIIALNYIFNGGNVILNDLRSGQVFNFIPSKIKLPEETSSNIGIQKDGSGLAATLYAIENRQGIPKKESRSNGVFYVRRKQIELELENVSIKDIVKYIKIANKSIDKITVVNDRFENLLKIKFSIIKENDLITLPISSMSDGTIKWISFVTSILTSPTVFSIEEPENYLHPLMQSEVIKLMRNTSLTKKKESAIMMSTHSETILNSAKPEEIIITEFKNGLTFAKRCSNADDITAEIKNTGFGLGYYYISGSIENE